MFSITLSGKDMMPIALVSGATQTNTSLSAPPVPSPSILTKSADASTEDASAREHIATATAASSLAGDIGTSSGKRHATPRVILGALCEERHGFASRHFGGGALRSSFCRARAGARHEVGSGGHTGERRTLDGDVF